MPYDTFPSQFINWRSIPQAGKKDRKVPWDVFKNQELDHLDEKNWRSFSDVQLTSGGDIFNGLVLARLDENNLPQHALFLLDLDDAVDPATGQPKQWAQNVINMFPGAMLEVSHSGTGFHIMGYCQPAAMIGRKHKFAFQDSGNNKLEWYCQGRFVALGHGAIGDVNLDWTATLQTLVPEKNSVDAAMVEVGSGPDGRWSGPTDDDDLIALMESNRAKEAPFAGQICVADFFRPVEEFRPLAHISYGHDPSKMPPYDFDGSSADMALMNHLAYYTGADVDRMERLFARSVMGQRDKARQRPQYVRDTSTMAAGEAIAAGRILQAAGKPSETIEQAKERLGAGMAIAADQPAILDGYFYVRDQDAIYTPSGTMMSPGAFERGHFGYIKFVYDPTATTQARQLGTALDAMVRNTNSGLEHRWVADTTVWNPELPTGAKVELHNGLSAVNTYRAGHSAPAAPADASQIEPFLYILRSNFPNEDDQRILLSWMAHVVQSPGRQIRWAPVLQGIQGCGKGTIHAALSYCVDYLHQESNGYSNVGRPSTDNLAEQYTGYAHRKSLIIVDEIGNHTKREITHIAEKLKPYVSDSFVSFRIMRNDAFAERNFGNWFFTTNYISAMLASRGERRYAHFISVLQTEEARDHTIPSTWFKQYNEWFDHGGNELIRGFLENYKFDPLPSVAPKTSTTEDAMIEGENDMVRIIRERVAMQEPGFRGGFVSAAAVRAALVEEDIKIPSGRWFGENMKAAGFPAYFRSSSIVMEENPFWDQIGKTPGKLRVYHKIGLVHERVVPVELYKVAQGWT